MAPSGSIITVLDQKIPWRFEDIERYQFISFEAACAGTDPNGEAQSAAATCLQQIKPDYIIFTAGEVQYAELEGGETAAALDRIDDLEPARGRIPAHVQHSGHASIRPPRRHGRHLDGAGPVNPATTARWRRSPSCASSPSAEQASQDPRAASCSRA